jgi:hypothetical protein
VSHESPWFDRSSNYTGTCEFNIVIPHAAQPAGFFFTLPYFFS